MLFEETNLNDNIIQAVKDMGYKKLTKIQEQSIPNIIDHKNIIATSNTGSGKTAAFMLPLINNLNMNNKYTQILVVTPTRELAIQIVQETKKFCKYLKDVKPVAIYGGQDIKIQIVMLKNDAKIVIGTPGRLLDLLKKKVLKLSNLKAIVLDEADEMLSMGFEKEVNSILEYTNEKVQKLLYSATITSKVEDIAKQKIKNAVKIECKENDTMLVNNIKEIAIEVKDKMKNECTLRILKKENAKNSIIFCNTKKKTEQIAEFLRQNSIKLEVLNSDIEQEERGKIIKKLKSGLLDTIVVTDVLARGIDIEDLELVINYDIPVDIEYYVHRIGRTARNGKRGVAYTYYIGKQIDKIHEIEDYTKSHFIYEDIPIIEEENTQLYNFPKSKDDKYIVTINLGKKDGIKAKDIVGAMRANIGISSDKIGIIQVNDDNSTIEIPKEYINDFVSKFKNGEIKEKSVNIVG